jgi:NAD(P)-dependent dehydrogenase (short-subunit alcohol dehydrogenase family)
MTGKLAVITGASRGNGRAIGEALTALGVDVIGTSRDPAGVPNPPAYPLLALDITDPGSVFAFVGALQGHPLFQHHSRVDILVNNAGRFVLGQIVPLPPTDFSFYLAQRDLGIRTLYSGHVMMTNVMLPLMPQQGTRASSLRCQSRHTSPEGRFPSRVFLIRTPPERSRYASTRTIWTQFFALEDRTYAFRR